MESKGYEWKECELGKVYYPKDAICFEADAEVNYMVYPWITKFEVKGIKIAKRS